MVLLGQGGREQQPRRIVPDALTPIKAISLAVATSFLVAIHGASTSRADTTRQVPRTATNPDALVAEASGIRFHSSFWMNLHHVLYAAAWARRPTAGTLRALAGALPAPLDAEMTASERDQWTAAVDYYAQHAADRDLLRDRGMMAVKRELVEERPDSGAIDQGMREALQQAEPIYRRHFWASHDRANRRWIDATVGDLRKIAPDVVPRLERLYDTKWFSTPVRVDVVWVGNRQGAYTTVRPPHATISSGDGNQTGWMAVEIVFHELSHELVLPLQGRLAAALGDSARDHGVLWHVIQFYLTGAAVQAALTARGIAYDPYMYSTGLFDRAWPQYRKPVEAHWKPYVEGQISLEQAIARTVSALR